MYDKFKEAAVFIAIVVAVASIIVIPARVVIERTKINTSSHVQMVDRVCSAFERIALGSK